MRKFLDGLYDRAECLDTVFTISTQIAVLLGIARREIGFFAAPTRNLAAAADDRDAELEACP